MPQNAVADRHEVITPLVSFSIGVITECIVPEATSSNNRERIDDRSHDRVMVSDYGEMLSQNRTFLALLKHAGVVTMSAARSEPDRDRIVHAASGTIAALVGPDMKSAEYIGLRDTSTAGHASGVAMQRPSMAIAP